MTRPTPEIDTFARLIATGVAETEAYVKSGIGSALACSVSQALKHPDVVARVAQFKASPSLAMQRIQRKAANTLTEDDIMEMLAEDRELARTTGQASAAVRSTELLGKQKGMFVERRDVKMDVRHLIAVRLDDAIRRLDPTRTLPAIER